MPEAQAVEVIHSYIQAGGNFIDTARVYEESEAIIGRALSKGKLREQIILATKTQKGNERDTIPAIREELEESLRRLKTEYVDLYYMITDSSSNRWSRAPRIGRLEFIHLIGS